MSYFRKNQTKLVLAVTGAVSLAVVALWQLNLFLLYRNANGELDMQAGVNHLWWSVGLGLLAAVVTFFVFSVLVHYDKDNERHIFSRARAWKIRR